MQPLRALEDLARRTRAAWVGLGQLGLVVLGLHFAADQLDDHLYLGLCAWGRILTGWGLEWAPLSDPDLWLEPATWGALGLELLAVLFAFNAITFTPHQAPLSFAAWRRNLSPEAVVLPLFWAPAALMGAAVLGMAVEDGLAGWGPAAGQPQVLRAAGVAVGVLAAWRLGLTGFRRVVAGLGPPKHPAEGLAWAPLALGFVVLLVAHGVPWRALWP